MPKLTQHSLNIRLAADPRAAQTDYHDDQVWEVTLGKQGDEPAITLQTHYGGRVGLARLVPMVSINGQTIYERDKLQGDLKVTWLSNYVAQLEIRPWAADVDLTFIVWVIDSHTLGGRFRLKNRAKNPVQLEVHLYLQAMSGTREIKVQQLHLSTPKGDAIGLNLKDIPQLQPVLLLEGGQGSEFSKLTSALSLGAGKEGVVRFVHAAYPSLDDSVTAAYSWLLERSWAEHLQAAQDRQEQLPVFNFSDNNLDAALGLGQWALLRSLISPTEYLPHPSPVFVRTPSSTASLRAWQGMTALATFQVASALAVLDPLLAQGIVRNYLAHQQEDGSIDGSLGADGQQGGYLLLPLLAHLTEIIYGYSQDKKFLEDVFPGLLKFYRRWLLQDADKDGFPEWHSLAEANYEFHPLCSMTAIGSLPTDINLLEAPDLAAYLLREGEALDGLAQELDKKMQGIWAKLAPAHDRLSAALQNNWHQDRFYYRDRTTDSILRGQALYKAKGDQALLEPFDLAQPNRLVIITDSTSSHRPTNLSATVQGINHLGQPVTEQVPKEAFAWYRSRCAATTQTVWQRVEKLQVAGLSRVFDYEVRTVDLTRQDISLLLPLITQSLPDEQLSKLFTLLEKAYWQPFGLSTLPKTDSEYPQEGSHAQHNVMPWVTLLGLALLQHGEGQASAKLFLNTAKGVIQSLTQQGAFFEWYNVETGAGVGTSDSVLGVLSLHWLVQLIGIYGRDAGQVVILGDYHFGKKTTKIIWHGVKIARNQQSLKLKFPSGYSIELPADAAPQTIHDPHYKPRPSTPTPFIEPIKPAKPTSRTKKISLSD